MHSLRYRAGDGRDLITVHADANSAIRPGLRCFLCGGGHKLEACSQFVAKSSEDTLKFFRDRRLCENCLSYTHFAGGLKGPRDCTIDQCAITRKHLQSLHNCLAASFSRNDELNNDGDQNQSINSRLANVQTQAGS